MGLPTPTPLTPLQTECLNEAIRQLAAAFPTFFIALIHTEDGSLAAVNYPPEDDSWEILKEVLTYESPSLGTELRFTTPT